MVLAIEYVPLALKNRQLKRVPSFLVFEFELHRVMPVFAGVGTFLSFFHQGSLGGLYGVLRGRPFAYREGFAIWPTTFFLFVLSAMAVGPSFVLLTTELVEAITRKRLVTPEVKQRLGKVSGILLVAYVLLKSVDTLVWLNSTSRAAGFRPWEYYAWKPFGFWILLAEIVVCGFLPAMLLVWPRTRSNPRLLTLGAVLACAGVVLNRFVLTIQTLALPTLPFDEFMTYLPSWQEIAVFGAVIAYGMIVYSFSYRYLTLFPQEKELKHVSRS
jgi:menaquinone reductase, integral membrane subunit